MKPKITFITRHYPPNRNINGESMRDMAKYLCDKFNIESNVICIERKGEGGADARDPVGKVYRLKTIYQGKKALWRFLAFLYDGFILIRKALSFKDTLIIVTTSPPMLPFWASLMFGKNIRWALWSLDLFPEGFQVAGKISEKIFLYRWVIKQTYKNSPAFLIALGPKQAVHVQKAYGTTIPYLTLPCGAFFFQDKSDQPPDWWEPGKLFLGYCGNLGDAHNPEIIKAVIDKIDPAKHRVILALYGVKADEVKEYAQGKPGVILVDRVSRNQLHFIDIHIVSLKKEFTHIMVPSKAVSAIFMGSPILFCGHWRSDNWDMFSKAGWFIDENEHIASQVESFLVSVDEKSVQGRKQKIPEMIKQLQNYVLDSYQKVAERSRG